MSVVVASFIERKGRSSGGEEEVEGGGCEARRSFRTTVFFALFRVAKTV